MDGDSYKINNYCHVKTTNVHLKQQEVTVFFFGFTFYISSVKKILVQLLNNIVILFQLVTKQQKRTFYFRL